MSRMDPATPASPYRRSSGSARGLARRDALLSAVVDDLAANGLGDISLRRLAQAAGTTHKVLLYHFDGVEDLLAQALRELRTRRIGHVMSAAASAPTLAEQVRLFWPVLAEDATGVRAVDQAIGLAMFDPDRFAHLAREASDMYRGPLRSLCPLTWSPERRVEVVEMILATMRGFLLEWRTARDQAAIAAGLRALVRAVEREEAD